MSSGTKTSRTPNYDKWVGAQVTPYDRRNQATDWQGTHIGGKADINTRIRSSKSLNYLRIR